MSKLKNIFIYKGFHRILNTRTSSRWFGKFANARLHPFLLKRLIRFYISIFRIDLNEYDFEFSKVKTFNEFFTRKLKEGARIWQDGITSPVDGRLLSAGMIEEGMLFQVKGMTFSVEEFTGEKGFEIGSFVNLYLSPADYHRVHAPFDMRITQIQHFPGKLLSVSKKNAETVKNLYVKNERVILSGDSAFGRFHFVFVGALNVGSIGLSHFQDFRTNLPSRAYNKINKTFEVQKGEEIGWFEMGSTVLILIEGTQFSHFHGLELNKKVKLGESLSS